MVASSEPASEIANRNLVKIHEVGSMRRQATNNQSETELIRMFILYCKML